MQSNLVLDWVRIRWIVPSYRSANSHPVELWLRFTASSTALC